MEALSERQKTVLTYLIQAHIESAQPVGSRMLTDYCNLHHSPATVRHEMGTLEEMGYLTHPHTSSGRVPTDAGYRYYVDYCIDKEGLSGNHPDPLERQIPSADSVQNLEAYGEQVLKILSDLSKEVGLIVIRESSGNDADALSPGRLLFRGASYMVEKPEFQNPHKIRSLFEALEEKEGLIHWISEQTRVDSLTVLIGRENEPEALRDCSVVSAAVYRASGQEIGSVAIIGPRRMQYRMVMPLVERTAKVIQRGLSAQSNS